MPSLTKNEQDIAFAIALGKALRMLRSQQNLKATGLAEAIGSQQQTYSAWEAGIHLPTLMHLLRIEQVTNVPMWKLIRAAEQLMDVQQGRERREAQDGED
jgi:transcriptional regulator with XRE-family HTH domain